MSGPNTNQGPPQKPAPSQQPQAQAPTDGKPKATPVFIFPDLDKQGHPIQQTSASTGQREKKTSSASNHAPQPSTTTFAQTSQQTATGSGQPFQQTTTSFGQPFKQAATSFGQPSQQATAFIGQPFLQVASPFGNSKSGLNTSLPFQSCSLNLPPRYAFGGNKVPFGQSYTGTGTLITAFDCMDEFDSTGLIGHVQSITHMRQYRDQSFEELRLQDYCQNRTSRDSPFGPPVQPSTRFGHYTPSIGSASVPQFDTTKTFSFGPIPQQKQSATSGSTNVTTAPYKPLFSFSSLGTDTLGTAKGEQQGKQQKSKPANPANSKEKAPPANKLAFDSLSISCGTDDPTKQHGFSDAFEKKDNQGSSDTGNTRTNGTVDLNAANKKPVLDNGASGGDINYHQQIVASGTVEDSRTGDAKLATNIPQQYQSSTHGNMEKETQDHAGPTDVQMAIKEGYYCIPTIKALQFMTPDELKKVNGFTVGRYGCGKVQFEQPVDLSQIPLDKIMASIVYLCPKSVTIYPDIKTKPPRGLGLNVPALVTLEQCYSTDKKTKLPIMDPSHPRFALFLEKLKSRPGTVFVDYEISTGSWKFEVGSF